jgi:hypothetical protein
MAELFLIPDGLATSVVLLETKISRLGAAGDSVRLRLAVVTKLDGLKDAA